MGVLYPHLGIRRQRKIDEIQAIVDPRGTRYVNGQRGENGSAAKLTTVDVAEIRALYAAGELQRVIAERFGVSQTNVSCIVRRVSWA